MKNFKELKYQLEIILGLPILYLLLGTIINLIVVICCILLNNYNFSNYNTLRLFYENKYSNIISGIVDIIFLIILIKILFKNNFNKFKESIHINKINFNDLINSILLGIGLSTLSILIVGTFSTFTNNYSSISNRINQSSSIIGVLFAITIVPVFEEIFFRGIIFGYLRKNYNIKLSIFIQALVFSIMHMNLIQGIYTFTSGIILALIYIKSKTIIAPIIVHIECNLFGILIWKTLFDWCKEASPIYLFLGILSLIIGILRLKNSLKK